MKTSKLSGRFLSAVFAINCLAVISYAQTGVYFAGTNAGTNNVSGDRNAFVGYQAGFTNITGNDNSFVGYQAGYVNIGNYNTFIGKQAGSANTSANSNSFLGANAGGLNTTGYANSFVGAFTGRNNTTGNNNSFVGGSSGYYNTTGSYNSFLGTEAGFYNTTGSNNNFIGYKAGRSNTFGAYNAFLGTYAGYNNTTGNRNSFVGHQAGYSNMTGGDNSFVGYQAGYANIIGFSNSFIGYQAGYRTIGSMNSFLGVSSGYSNVGGHYNTYLGNNAGYLNVSGWSNVAVGTSAGYNNLGGNNTFIGYNTNTPVGATFANSAAIGYRAYVSAANSMVLGSIEGVNGATDSTKVGIGTTAPSYLLHVNGVAAKPGGGDWTAPSDRRLKQDITDFTDGLALLEKVHPVWYRYNGEAGLPKDKKYVGIIAQEMQQIAPYTIGQFTYQDTTGKKTQYLDYDANALTYILVNSVQEQQKQLLEKDAQISAIQQELSDIKALLLKQQPTIPNAEDGSSGGAYLWQNEPNPTDGATVIRYRIPKLAVQAQMKIFSTTGQELHSFDLPERGVGSLTVPASLLPSGTYVYRLMVDGTPIAAKKLILEK